MNEIAEPGEVHEDTHDLTIQPEDDGLQITDFIKGDFEWWYFDINDQTSGCFLKIVLHIGTDPLRTRVIPQIAVSVNTPEKSESLYHPFIISEMIADTRQCNLTVKDKLKIWTEFHDHLVYFIKIDIPRFKCNLRFTGEIEGLKPFGEKILYQSGKKKGDFSWVILMPKGSVEGDFVNENKKYSITGATGYHDHNYIKPDRKYPLYLDNLASKWYWGKCYADMFTVIFADIYSRTSRILSLIVAEDNKIIHSSNVLTDCSVKKYGYDKILRSEYPSSLSIKSLDEHFPFQAEFEFEKILDRKDLLEGVNPVLKFLIKRLVARPVYHGILTKVRLEINKTRLEGSGNFESMVFRGK
jgi:hypothetical protein